jgi:hypothetical protein
VEVSWRVSPDHAKAITISVPQKGWRIAELRPWRILRYSGCQHAVTIDSIGQDAETEVATAWSFFETAHARERNATAVGGGIFHERIECRNDIA